MAVVTNSNGSTAMDITFGFYGTGGVGYRDFMSYINQGSKVNLRVLNGLNPSYFLHVENGQELSERNSNFFDHIQFRLYKNGNAVIGWGPEFVGGSEGPYGLWGKFGTTSLALGSGYRLIGSVYRGETLLATKTVDFEVVDEEIPLPVVLESLTAKLNAEGQVQLNWKTTSEKGFKGFEIERSETGVLWSTIGYVGASGDGTRGGDYSFLDAEEMSGVMYFRLRMVDFDGSFEYSRIQSVRINVPDSYVFYDQLQKALYIKNCPDVDYIQLIDNRGMVLKVRDSNFSRPLSLKGFSTGIYFVRYRTTKGTAGRAKILHYQ